MKKIENTGDSKENVEHVTIDISLGIEEGIDPQRATKYLEKLFVIGDKIGELLHEERLTLGEALFVIYMLEKGAFSVMDISDPEDIYHILAADNKSRIDMIANMIIRHNAEKEEKDGQQQNIKDEQKN